MEEQELKDYEKACRIAAEALQFGRKLIVKGSDLLDVTDKTEAYILQRAKLAFPVQLSLNSTAAHYYPDHDEKTALTDQVIKIDVGVHVNGFVGDNALTVDLSGQYGELVKASQEALKSAIAVVKDGARIGDIGAAIQETIIGYGFSPVRNLSGHGLEQYNIHSYPSIPNTATSDPTTLTKGQVIAIEPFASTGAGVIMETSNSNLFQLIADRPVRDPTTREILNFIQQYEGMPFAKRWLVAKYPLFKVNLALKNMLNNDIIREFTPLVDRAKGIVSQAEHTMIVEEGRARVLTQL
jgi:methionyl aminopeptidase